MVESTFIEIFNKKQKNMIMDVSISTLNMKSVTSQITILHNYLTLQHPLELQETLKQLEIILFLET